MPKDTTDITTQYIYGYSICNKTNRIVGITKNAKKDWEDQLSDYSTVFKYQNCYGKAWRTIVKPALNNTPMNASIVLKVFPENKRFKIMKRDISQVEKGISTFTIIKRL